MRSGPTCEGEHLLSNNPAADWSDPSNSFWGTATPIAGGCTNLPTCDWNIYVDPTIYATVLDRMVGLPLPFMPRPLVTGVVRSLNIDIDTTSTGVGSVAPADPSQEYYRSTGLLFALPMEMYGLPQTSDAAWFGQTDNPLAPDPEAGVPLVFSCAGSPAAVMVAPPFTETAGLGGVPVPCVGVAGPTSCYVLTDAAANFGALPPLGTAHVVLDGTTGQVADIVTQTATTLTIADAMPIPIGLPFLVYNVASAFGPSYPMGATAGLCAALTPEPGYSTLPGPPVQTVLTALDAARLEAR
jgi:hypothetical protein